MTPRVSSCPACAAGLVTEPCARCNRPPAVLGGQGRGGAELVETSRGCLGLVFLASCFAVLACVVAAGCWVWAAIQR